MTAGERAVYSRDTGQVTCLRCAEGIGDLAPTVTTDAPEAGVAGASARREHQRRVEKREQRMRTAHPRLGGLILALTDEPRSTTAWQRGARGEEVLGRRLDGLTDRGALLLYDRRIPGGRANIDHIAVSAAGVFVIDAKRYRGRPELRIDGGLLRPRTEKLIIERRDRTSLVHAAVRQVDLVRTALGSSAEFAGVSVHGMLCFVDADWPLIGGSFTIAGIDVLWPAKAAKIITADGQLTPHFQARVRAHLANAFPAA